MSSRSVRESSSPSDWKRVAGELHTEYSGPFRRVFYTHRIPAGKYAERSSALPVGRILFISDLHCCSEYSSSFFPGMVRYRYGEQILGFLLETIHQYGVEHILFGGDLLTYLCSLEQALDFFKALKVPGKKTGVYGNWDLKNVSWLPCRYWEQRWKEEGGLELLCNQQTYLDSIRLFGMDEFRNGAPDYTPPADISSPNWILTHNPDAVPAVLSEEDLSHTDLILCGHTHGGQIRLPLFGAVQTSSIHWKRFEYGLYQHRKTRTKMLVTAGLGTTLIRQRLFCPPEGVIIDVKQDPA